MSEYHRVYIKLLDLLEQGHCVQLEKRHNGYEITMFEHVALNDHMHTNKETFAAAVESAHRAALYRWPQEDD